MQSDSEHRDCLMPFQERYKSGNTPWEIHRADCNLINIVQNTPIAPCNVLDIGCGTGSNTIWLQQHGFNAIGVDSSEVAIDRARDKAHEVNVQCDFYVLDFLRNNIPDAPFNFAFDRGCFHHFLEYDKLSQFAEKTSLNWRIFSVHNIKFPNVLISICLTL